MVAFVLSLRRAVLSQRVPCRRVSRKGTAFLLQSSPRSTIVYLYPVDRHEAYTVLVVLDPLAIKTEHTFRWGNPPHVYSIQSVDGIVQDETTGVRFSSEIVVIR